MGAHPEVVELGEGLGALVQAGQVLLVGGGQQALHPLDRDDRGHAEPGEQHDHEQESAEDAGAKRQAHEDVSL
ncbi:hypothetical protein D3C87_1934510 [compost metagenome]